MKNYKHIVFAALFILTLSFTALAKSGTISTTKTGTISTTRTGTISTTAAGTISTTRFGTISTTRAEPDRESVYRLNLFGFVFSLLTAR